MARYKRRRSTLRLPIWMSVVLMSTNIALMVIWIVLLVLDQVPGAMTIGIIAFALSLFGFSFYLVLTIKEISLNRRQANFVDSVTHELKTPIASLKLYLETLQMRSLEAPQREEFYDVMEQELRRLDRLINQLLEVGRLDAVGQDGESEDIPIEALLRRCAESASAHHQVQIENVFTFDIEPAVIIGRRLPLEMIFGNLLDNAIKYSAPDPQVKIVVRMTGRDRVSTRIFDNGDGVAHDSRKKIFDMFYRGGDELHRTRKGTGLGLYIVRSLVHILGGRVGVRNRVGSPGAVFEVELTGRVLPDCMAETAMLSPKQHHATTRIGHRSR